MIWANSPQECIKSAKETIKVLQELGFQINVEKSRLKPESKFQWLGLQWDLDEHTVCIPSEKRKEIAKSVRAFIRNSRTSRRAQERVLGSLQFAAISDPILKVRLKDINRVWRGRANTRLRDKKSALPAILRKRLLPWTTAKSLSKIVPLQFPAPDLIVHTDASLTGWGGHSPDHSVQGNWSEKFKQFHINILEAMAVLLTLKRLKPQRGIHIQLVLDSNVIVN